MRVTPGEAVSAFTGGGTPGVSARLISRGRVAVLAEAGIMHRAPIHTPSLHR